MYENDVAYEDKIMNEAEKWWDSRGTKYGLKQKKLQ
jgi:hypothetical protein